MPDLQCPSCSRPITADASPSQRLTPPSNHTPGSNPVSWAEVKMAVVNRRIAVTPIHLDLTGRRLLKRLRTEDWTLPDESAPDGSTT